MISTFYRLLFTLITTILFTFACSANESNYIKNIKVIDDKNNEITVEVDYNYTGDEGKVAFITAIAIDSNSDELKHEIKTVRGVIKGKGKKLLVIKQLYAKIKPYQTDKIEISFMKSPLNHVAFYTKTISYTKDWHSAIASYDNPLTKAERRHMLLSDAISLIDNSNLGGETLQIAKKYLEKILLEDPKNVQAYLEMARIRMKEDKNVTGHDNSIGVTQAERLINIALDIDENYANAYVLLGYVKAAQNDISGAIKVLEKAKSLGTKNAWLYFNWGLALEKKGDYSGAMKIYEEAIALPLKTYMQDISLKSNNHAIPYIYSKLLSYVKQTGDWKKVDRIYQSQLDVVNAPCQYAEYADFRLKRFGDYDKSINYAESALDRGCEEQARAVLAQAYLVKSTSSVTLDKEEASKLYYKSQALTQNTIKLITQLASSKYTEVAIPTLLSKGLNINSIDAQKMSPLAYAIIIGDKATTESLLKHGADPDLLVTKNGLSSLMLAIAYNKNDLATVLIKKGADTELKTEAGFTALSIAKRVENKVMQNILESQQGI